MRFGGTLLRLVRLPVCRAAAWSVATLLGASLWAQDMRPARPVLGTVGGQTIYEEELPAGVLGQLQKMEQQIYFARRGAFEAVAEQKLLEAAAKKKGVSVEDLLKAEVDAKVPQPTDEEIQAYYDAREAQLKKPLDQPKEKIAQLLKTERFNQARRAYFERLLVQALEDGEVTVLVAPPKIEVSPDPGRLRGSPQAPVTIVEFSDFSCPYCRKAEPGLKNVLSKYEGKVKLSYRDFPLRQIHPHAEMAAEASRCAGEQEKYWEYHDLLWANEPEKQDRDSLVQDATSLKLDAEKFGTCLSSGRFKGSVEEDLQMGTRAGVTGTPAFFINGVFLKGVQSEENFERVIDEALSNRKAGEKKPGT